jgi:hypothetical protein
MGAIAKLILFMCFTICVFIAGYLVGNHHDSFSPTTLSDASTESKQLHSVNTSLEQSPAANTNKITADNIPISVVSDAIKETNELNSAEDSPQLNSANNDVLSLFDELISYTQSNGDYSLFGKKIDEIRQVLINDSAELASLLEHFEQIPIDSQANYMLVSILMGLPQELSQTAIIQISEKTLNNNSNSNKADFLELIARTGIKSTNITNAIKDIAIYSENNEETLRALDMLMPYEMSVVESEQVKERLSIAIADSETDNQAYYFSQLLRFSSAREREQIASREFDKDEPNYAIQSNILDALQSGVMDRSPKLKESLLNIANADNHPLQTQSIYTLLYRFDLSQTEYQNLVKGKDLDLNRF